MRDGFIEVCLLARDEHDLGAIVPERFGDLQSEATRASGDEHVLARERPHPL